MVKNIKRSFIVCFSVLLIVQSTTSCSSGSSKRDKGPLFGFFADSGENKELIKNRRFPRDNPGALTYNRAQLPKNRKRITTSPDSIIPQYQPLPSPATPTTQQAAPHMQGLTAPSPSIPMQQPQPQLRPPQFSPNITPSAPIIPTPPSSAPEINPLPAPKPNVPVFNPDEFAPAPSIEEISPWIPETHQPPGDLALPPPPQSYFQKKQQEGFSATPYWQPPSQAPQPFIPQEPFNNQWQPPQLPGAAPIDSFSPTPGFPPNVLPLQEFPPTAPTAPPVAVPPSFENAPLPPVNNIPPTHNVQPMDNIPSMGSMPPMNHMPSMGTMPPANNMPSVNNMPLPPGAITNPEQIQPWIQQPESMEPQYWQPPHEQPSSGWQPPVVTPNQAPPLPMPGIQAPMAPPSVPYAPQPIAPEQPWQPQQPIPLQQPYPQIQGNLNHPVIQLAMSSNSFPDLRSVPKLPKETKEDIQNIPGEIKELQKQQKDIEKKRDAIHDIQPNGSVEPSESSSDNIS